MNETGPKVLGHEFSGVVTDVGDNATGIAVGDLVAVQPNIADGTCPACLRGEPNLCENYGFIGINGWGGGFSEYVVAPAENVFVLPEGFSAETGALIEPLTVGWAAVRKSGAAAGGSALIVGGGPVGLAILLSLRAIGVSRTVVSEVSDRRKALAASLGAEVVDPRETDVADYCRQGGGGAGVDVAFDASGAGPVAFEAAFGSLRTGGTLIVAASSREPVAVDTASLLTTEKHITGSFAYTRSDFQAVIDAVAEGRMDPRPLVSSTISLDEVIEGGLDHLLGDGRATEVKILVAPA
jgi:2-desacetyl-2-hydroxyethyl bacteriochlorophyllide A dehydrogenase